MQNFYPSQIVRLTVGRNRNQLARRHVEKFSAELDPIQIEKEQLDLFNRSWNRAQKLPFYANWAEVHMLPREISSLEELSGWPILTKDALRKNLGLIETTTGVTGYYQTSGSTGEPFRFPRGEKEIPANYSTMWAYRIANNLKPFDPFLLVANTALGSAQSWWAQRKLFLIRCSKDILGNSWKTNGFIATDDEADQALRALKILGSKYVIGYPSGIAALARRAKERGITLPSLSHAILTSESINDNDISTIEDALKVKVLIEYGAIELGVVAGTFSGGTSWPLKVNWWSYLLRLDDGNSAAITTLQPRAFPLINYAIGDVIQSAHSTPAGSVLSIEYVEGRTRDVVDIATRDGGVQSISTRRLTTLVQNHPEVTSIQVAQRTSESVELYVVAPKAEQGDVVAKIASSFKRNARNYRPGTVNLTFLDRHIPSSRGKRGVLVPFDRKRSQNSISLITE